MKEDETTLGSNANKIIRTRALIGCHAALSSEPYQLTGRIVHVRHDLRGPDRPSSIHVIDVECDSEKNDDIRNIAIKNIDILNQFVDIISVISFGPTELISIISTCPQEVDVDVPFPIVTHEGSTIINRGKIEVENFVLAAQAADEKILMVAIREVSKGLAAYRSDQAVLHYFIAAEQLAREEFGEPVMHSCPECGYKWAGDHIKMRQAIIKLLEGKLSRKEIEACSKIRHKAAHGGMLGDISDLETARQMAAKLEPAIIAIVADKMGCDIEGFVNVSVGLPISVHQAIKRRGGGFDVISSSWQAPAEFVKLLSPKAKQVGDASFGVPTLEHGPAIPQLAWPF